MTDSNPAGNPGPRADTGTFSRTISALQRLETLRDRVNDAHQEQRLALSQLLITRMALHKHLFGALVPDYAETYQDIDPKRCWLESWRIEGERLVVEFGSSFRGESHFNNFTVPVRYLTDGGEEAMRAEAAELSERRDREAGLHAEAATRAEREQLQELLRKYPDTALDSITNTP